MYQVALKLNRNGGLVAADNFTAQDLDDFDKWGIIDTYAKLFRGAKVNITVSRDEKEILDFSTTNHLLLSARVRGKLVDQFIRSRV